MRELPYSDDLNFWKTSKSRADTWIDRAEAQIVKLGGVVLASGYGSEPAVGRAAFMLGFEIEGNKFKVVWPVLPNKYEGDEKAARVQAATMLYHDIKAKCLMSKVFGSRVAFFSYLMLPDGSGRTASEASFDELSEGIPAMFSSQQLDSGDVIE